MSDEIQNDRKDFFALLPIELFFKILNELSIIDLLACSQVSRKWREVCDDDVLWLKKCAELKIPNFSDISKASDNNESPKQRCLNCARLLFNWQSDNFKIDPISINVHAKEVVTGLTVFERWAASCSVDGTVAVFDLLSGQHLYHLIGHHGGVWAMVCFRDLRLPKLACSNGNGFIYVYNLLDGFCLFILPGHSKIVRSLSVSQIDNIDCNIVHLISGSRDCNLRVWDMISGNCVHLLKGHIGAVKCVRSSSSLIVSGSYDHSVRIWDLKCGTCLFVLIGHIDRVYTLCLGKQVILSSSLDTTIRSWSIDTGVCLHVLEGHQSLTCDMVMNSTESIVVSGNGDNSVRVWLISTGECLLKINGINCHSPSFGFINVHVVLDRFIVCSNTDGTVTMYNLSDGSFIREIIRLKHAFSGGRFWGSVATDSYLLCSAGSVNGCELTKLILFNFQSKQNSKNVYNQ